MRNFVDSLKEENLLMIKIFKFFIDFTINICIIKLVCIKKC